MKKKTNKNFTIGLLQLGFSANVDDNLKKAVSWVGKAAKKGAQVICLPELFRTQYFCQKEDVSIFDLAETVPGPSTEAMKKAAKKNKVVIVVPIFEKRAAGVYHNSAVIINADGNVAGLYRKMHIPDDPAFYEKFYFTPGDLGFKSFETKYGNIGTLFAGINGILKVQGLPLCKVRAFCFILLQLAGIRTKKKSTAKLSLNPGKLYNVDMRLQMVFMLPR